MDTLHGAKIVSDLKNKGLCSDIEAERMLAFTNNSGPLFIIGTVGISLFKDITIGFLLLFTHILSCLTVGIIFRFWKYNQSPKYTSYSNPTNIKKITANNISSLGTIVGESIKSATNTIMLIGGYVVLFSVIISIINNSGFLEFLCLIIRPIFQAINLNPDYLLGFISGIIELTNGVNIISNIHNKNISINIVICAFLIGFGGVSVLLQVWGIISNAKISIKPYIIGKFLQGIFASLYTYLFIHNFAIFNLNLLKIF